MRPAPAIEHYQELSLLTRELRDAAGRGEWDRLTEIQQKRTELVAALAPVDTAAGLDESARRLKNELISQVLADEAETRSLVNSWLAQLQEALHDGRRELRLLKEYRRHSG